MIKDELLKIKEEALKAISDIDNMENLNNLRVNYLGKKGVLTNILKSLKDIPNEEKPKFGQLVNETRELLETRLNEAKNEVLRKIRQEKIKAEKIDVTLPAKRLNLGHKHPNRIALEEVEKIFIGMGYRVVEGPEIEYDEYNFAKLNIPANHPAKDEQDTFYKLLRFRPESWKRVSCLSE